MVKGSWTESTVVIDSLSKKNRGAALARAAGMAMLLPLAFVSCGETVRLVQTSPSGGVVTYPLQPGKSHLASPLRGEALQRMSQHCAGGYAIIKEGEAKSRTRVQEGIGGEEIIVQRRWGLQFRCQEELPNDSGSPLDR